MVRNAEPEGLMVAAIETITEKRVTEKQEPLRIKAQQNQIALRNLFAGQKQWHAIEEKMMAAAKEEVEPRMETAALLELSIFPRGSLVLKCFP